MDPVELTGLTGLACQCQAAGLHIRFRDCIQTYERVLACRAHISATTVYASRTENRLLRVLSMYIIYY